MIELAVILGIIAISYVIDSAPYWLDEITDALLLRR